MLGALCTLPVGAGLRLLTLLEVQTLNAVRLKTEQQVQ